MAILNALLQITIFSGVIFFATLLLKKAFKNKMSPFLHFAVWAVFLLRLIVPVTLETPVHFFTYPTTSVTLPAQASLTPDEAISVPLKPVGEPSGKQNAAAASSDIAAAPVQTSVSAVSPAAAAKPLTESQIVLIVWLGGTALGLMYIALLAMLLSRKISLKSAPASAHLQALFAQVKDELRIKARLRLLCQYECGSPALLFPRTILMPMDKLAVMDEEQIKNCLRHECMHFRRGDHLTCLLLTVLNTVYWFNPFMWPAYFEIRKDMETACDGAVVKQLAPGERRGYAELILSLSGYTKQMPVMLSMARSKRSAERRIKGVFMAQTSTRSMKWVSATLALVLLVCCFTTACQPMLEEPIVISKLDDFSQSITEIASPASLAADESSISPLYEALNIPQHWSMQTTAFNDTLNIKADVDIELPNVSALPVATAVLREFSQQEIEKIVEVVLGKNLKFMETAMFTKEVLEQQMAVAQQSIADQKPVEIKEGTFVHYSQSDIDSYKKLYQDAPAESELTQKDLKIETLTDNGISYPGVSVKTDINGQHYVIRAGSLLSRDAVRSITISTFTPLSFGTAYGARFYGTYRDTPYGVPISKDDAAAKAESIASQLTDELKLCYVVPTACDKLETDRNWGWACVFMREINGCPTAYETTEVGSDMEDETKNPIHYESMTIIIDDLGVTGFEWKSPMRVTSVDNENAAILPFEKIEQIAAKQLANRQLYDVKNNEYVDPGTTLLVTKAELGLMRVMKRNSDEYYYLPVWNFFSDIDVTEAYKDKYHIEDDWLSDLQSVDANGNPSNLVTGYPQGWGAVTINAIDGSVIDRNLGY